MSAIEARIAAFATVERVRVYARLVAIVIGGGYLVAVVIGVVTLHGFTEPSGAIVGADYSAFYGAGHRVLEGRTDLLYDLDAQAAFTRELVAPAPWRDEVHPFVSPPYWALCFVPLAALPYPLSFAMFTAISIAALALCARLLGVRAIHALGFFPVLLAFLNGQTSLLLLACFTAFYVLLRREREVVAGLTIGLLAIKPPLLIGPAMIALGARRWRVLVGIACTCAAWLAIGVVVMPNAMRAYVAAAPEIVELLRASEYHTWGQTSLFGFATLLFDPLSHAAGAFVGYALVGIGALAIARMASRTPWTPTTGRWDLAIAAQLALGFVVSPHLFLYDASLLVLPIAIVASRITRPNVLLDGGPILVATFVMAASLFVGPYLSLACQGGLRSIGAPAIAVQLCTLAIVWFAVRVDQRSRSELDPAA
jgi:hypothetical protein